VQAASHFGRRNSCDVGDDEPIITGRKILQFPTDSYVILRRSNSTNDGAVVTNSKYDTKTSTPITILQKKVSDVDSMSPKVKQQERENKKQRKLSHVE
jgi:hypothetical protein